MGVIELFLVFAMVALDFAVVTECVGANQLVADAKADGSLFEQDRLIVLAAGKRLVNSEPLFI